MKLYKNQLGALNPLVIVLIVVVLGAVGFAGWKVYDNNKSSDSSSSTGAAVELTKEEKKLIDEECKKQYNDDDYCKFASNWSMSGVYKVTFTNTAADGSTSSTTMEVDGENSSTVSTENGQEVAAYIMLNEVSYMKDYDAGVWYKIPKAEDAPVSDSTAEVTEDLDFVDDYKETADQTSVKALGKEACGDKTCFKYQIIDPADTETTENLVWFDDEDYMIVRMKVTTSDGAVSDSTYSYPASITITEPSPVQDMPQFDPSSLGL